MNVTRRLLQPYKWLFRTISTFPVISPPPTRCHGNIDVNMDLYTSVRDRRKWVWSRDCEIASTPKDGRKLTTRERVDLLRDPGSEVIHIGTLAGLGMPYGDVINASMEVVIATVCGELCMITGNDWIFKGGTIYPIGVKKQLRGQEIARQNNLPCIYLADSGGAFLPLQSGIYPDKEHGGRVFRNQAVMSSLGIPQVAVVVGPCTAGGAYIPAMSDEAVIVQDIGFLYLAGPPLVRAATGAKISPEELGGASVHCSISGCTDHYALTEEEAFQTTRAIVESLNLQSRRRALAPVEEPLLSGEDADWARLVPTEGFDDWPMMEVISRLVDGSRLQQFKERYGPRLCTGFARISGHLVGVVANLGDLCGEECLKASHFIRLCTLRSLPLIFLVNVTSDPDFLSPGGSDGLTAKGRGQMMATLAAAHVPKITVVLGGGYGPSYYAMCGRPMEPNFLFHWPHARCGWAEPQHLLETMGEEARERGEGYLSQFQREETSASTSDLCHDGVILPSETRQVLSQCLDVCTRYTSHTHPAHMSALRM